MVTFAMQNVRPYWRKKSERGFALPYFPKR